MTLRMGYEQAKTLQEYQTLSLLLSQVFGGKSNDEIRPPANIAEAHLQLNKVFNG